MFASSLIKSLRAKVISLLIRILETEELREWTNRKFSNYGKVRKTVKNVPNPYDERLGVGNRPERSNVIFVTGKFRSGSTLLWNIFRKMEGCTAYYEPFNERRWFDDSMRGETTDSTHRGVKDYWAEYEGLENLGIYYREDWIRHELYMDEGSYNWEMKCYINELIRRSKGIPVFQFNRVDFRLGWLRANYAGCKIIHIYRNPRDQWCSILGDVRSYPFSSLTSSGFRDRFYHKVWIRDLCGEFPFLTDFKDRHQYYTFYLLWKLSFDFGKAYADLSLSMEELTNSPRSCLRDIASATGCDIDVENMDLGFVENYKSLWRYYAPEEWFGAIEHECEVVLDDFFRGGANDENPAFE